MQPNPGGLKKHRQHHKGCSPNLYSPMRGSARQGFTQPRQSLEPGAIQRIGLDQAARQRDSLLNCEERTETLEDVSSRRGLAS